MNRRTQIYKLIAEKLDALRRCEAVGNEEWAEKHREKIDAIMDTAPSGSGWDLGTTLVDDACRRDRLVFRGGFHHMNEQGYYGGWTDHEIHVRPDFFFGFDICRITGRDRNDIKEYLGDMFWYWLSEEIIESDDGVKLAVYADLASGREKV